jgi:hypothetical protein
MPFAYTAAVLVVVGPRYPKKEGEKKFFGESVSTEFNHFMLKLEPHVRYR